MSDRPKSEPALDELRRILLNGQDSEVGELRRRLDDPDIRAEDVSRIVSEAILLRSRRDHSLSGALLPTVKDVVGLAVKEDPRTFVTAIFPLIGPAIRRAISETLGSMIQSLNRTMESSLTIQGLKWRLEAARTKRPLAEVVLLNSLAFRVEQVFLIHRDSGLLLEHVAAEGVETDEGDLVSGMLTAVQEFVKDSFKVGEGEELQTVELGDLQLWLTPGPKAILACVIRGDAPEGLRTGLEEVLEEIHGRMAYDLDHFQGETEPFGAVRPLLDSCLKSALNKKRQGLSPALVVATLILVAALGTLVFFRVQDNNRWRHYLAALSAEPGVVVTYQERGWLRKYLAGLKDPLAADPRPLLDKSGLNPERVVANWQPFASYEPTIVIKRAAQALAPPEGVRLSLKKDLLILRGKAKAAWRDKALNLGPLVPGVARVDASGLEVIPEVVTVKPDSTLAEVLPGVDPLRDFGLARTPGLALAGVDLARKTARLLSLIKAEPGVMVASVQVADGVVRITGLRDPLAVDFKELVAQAGLEGAKVRAVLGKYISLEPQLILRRARLRLRPPDTVELGFEGDTLSAKGSSSWEWKEKAGQLALSLPGVNSWRDKELKTTDPAEYTALIKSVEAARIQFTKNTFTLEPSQTAVLENLTTDLIRLKEWAGRLNRRLELTVIGQADPTGGKSYNLELSRRRARTVAAYLARKNLSRKWLTILSVGGGLVDTKTNGAAALALDRKVTFKIKQAAAKADGAK